MFIGKVMPNERPKYKEGFASGMAYRNTAGTTMYEALADSTINMAASATGIFNTTAKPNAMLAWTHGPKAA